jgi:hypothetical protein
VMGKAARLEMPVDTCAVPPATHGAILGANWIHLGWLYTLRGAVVQVKGLVRAGSTQEAVLVVRGVDRPMTCGSKVADQPDRAGNGRVRLLC